MTAIRAHGVRAVDRAEREAVADVAARALFGVEVVVVLRNGGFEHGRAEVRSVLESLGEGVVGQEAEAVRVAAAHVDVAGVVPALRGVFEQVDGAHREASWLDDRRRSAGRRCLANEADLGCGRRGWIRPGPGCALLIRCERCRWNPPAPR